jgi:hypothetical protein
MSNVAPGALPDGVRPLIFERVVGETVEHRAPGFPGPSHELRGCLGEWQPAVERALRRG